MNGSIHVHMLIIEEMWNNFINSLYYKCGFKIVTCALINYGKCKMQLLNNGFNMFNFNGSTHVSCW